ncbi:general transcription factor II-I repeat domain-containing protein 2-like [Paramisgurnus dabryanus]|uniref:general transcription factor II-I repeat domain-containing protein 2-like n=1 Tax=Paramisgurnus dabryanus TaxID=90735 RepID=UPI0031F352B4
MRSKPALFMSLLDVKNNATEASYQIANCIAKRGKPFTDGEYIKDAFLSCSEVLFDGLPNKETIMSKIKDIPMSARTVQRRIEEMAENVNEQQTAGLKDAMVFSVALDESVDINDIPRLAVMAKYCDSNVREELCCLKAMTDTTKGEDIAKVFVEHFEERGVDVGRIFAITTDGAPAMVGKQKGAVRLIEEKVGHPIMKLHCIIHQENLCAKMSNSDLNEVMATVVKIVNFIVKRSSLTHRQFQSLLEEMDSTYKDIPLHSAVRWLSCGKVLERFVGCFDSVKAFLAEKGQVYNELDDETWVLKLMFLADITGHLNELNLRLQGAEQTILNMFETWASFVDKLTIFSRDISSSKFQYFKHVRELSAQRSINTGEISKYISELESEFKTRFGDFRKYGPMFPFLINPESFDGHEFDESLIGWMNTQDMEMQLIELKTSALWMTKFAELRKELETTAGNNQGSCIFTCWASLPEKFCCLKRLALALLTVFGSTYLCEQIFSHMNSVLSPSRNRLSVDHSEACVQLKVTHYTPKITELSKGKQDQGAH